MNLKKFIFYCFVVLLVFIIYKCFSDNKINYVALGDSLAEGRNPYGDIDYGYTDYIADYFRLNDKLKIYINGYTNRDYKIQNIIDDINNNKKIKHNNKTINIRKTLRESDLVTISVGMNDIMEEIKYTKNIELNKQQLLIKMDQLSLKFEEMIKNIKKYAKNQIIVVGYYNPINNFKYKKDIDQIIEYLNQKNEKICSDNKIVFIKTSDMFSDNLFYYPNPNSFNPNIYGYKNIYNEIKKYIAKT